MNSGDFGKQPNGNPHWNQSYKGQDDGAYLADVQKTHAALVAKAVADGKQPAQPGTTGEGAGASQPTQVAPTDKDSLSVAATKAGEDNQKSNPPQAPEQATTHAGRKVYPTRIKGADGQPAPLDEKAKALKSLAEKAQLPGNENQTIDLADVADDLTAEAKEKAGIDLTGYRHTADLFSVRHALKQHGNEAKEKARGQLGIGAEDIAAIHDVVTNPDRRVYGAYGPRKQALVGSIKRASDGSLLAVQEVRTGRKTLALTSIRKYPATTDFDSIARTLLSNARSDGGDAASVAQPATESKPTKTQSEVLSDSAVQRTNANSAMVWQIIHGPIGEALNGPPGKYPGSEMLAGSPTMGARGWATKRNAEAALAELKRRAAPAGRAANEQEWVDGVTQAAKDGLDLNRATLDKLYEVRPNITLASDANVPTGYQKPTARKSEADEAQARKDNRKAAKQPASHVAPSVVAIENVAIGNFGPILTQYKGDAQGAIKALTELQDGEAVAALNHPEVGDIDLVWGQKGTNKHDGFGLSKLVRWHSGVLGDLQGVISSMKVTQRSENRVQLESETHKGAVRLQWDGESKHWLMTAFEKDVDEASPRTDTTGKQGKDDSLPDAHAASVAQATEESKPTEAKPEAAAQAVADTNTTSITPLVDTHVTIMESVREGKATPDEYQASFAAVAANLDAIKAELSTRTKDQLLKAGGYFFQTRYKSETKADIVGALYQAMLREYALGKEFGPQGFMMGEMKSYDQAKSKALADLVEGQTAEMLADYAAEQAKAGEEVKARRATSQAAIENPQTLNDFRTAIRYQKDQGKTFKEARLMLTPEQRAKYDELEAETTREARDNRKRAARTEVRAAGQTVGGEIVATKHTKAGYDLFVVQLAERVSKEDYSTILASAKRMGGWYSAFRGNGAVPGFQFKDKTNAEAFLKLAAGNTTDTQAQADTRRDAFDDDRSQTGVERLTEMADRLDARADESLGYERKANTARRARFAASAEASANGDKAMAKTMHNLADAIKNGTAKFLDTVRQKTQVEMLHGIVQTAKYQELLAKHPTYAEQEKRKGEAATGETADFAEFPGYTAFRSDLATLARQLLEVDGTKKIGQSLMKVADDTSDAYTAFAKENSGKVMTFSSKTGGVAAFGTRDAAEAAIKRSGYKGKAVAHQIKRGEYTVIISASEAMARGIWQGDGDKRITLSTEFGAEMVQAIGRRANKANHLSVPWQLESAHDKLKALSRMGIETPAEFRSALREFIGLREQAVEADKVKMMERAMIGRTKDGLDFFPTPQETAEAMIEAAEITPDMAVLEPSAGMGHIADRIRAAGAEPDVIEMAADRQDLLEAKGFRVIGRDFMEINPREFFTFGDVFKAEDGTTGVMRGLGGMGSDRVRLVEADGRETYHSRDDLTGTEKRGTDSGYDRIIMNPPFSNGRDIAHVQHAYSLLRPGGRLVALMGESAFTNQNKRAEEFRAWLEELGGTDEKLAEGTFQDPSLPVNTGANARMVVIEKISSNQLVSKAEQSQVAIESVAKPAAEGKPAASPKVVQTKEDDAGNVAMFSRSGSRTTGLSVGHVQKMANMIAKRWVNAPEIVVVQSMNDPQVPADAFAEFEQLSKRDNQAGETEGFFSERDNKVYLIAGKLDGDAALVRVLFHESLGHFGLRGVYGSEMGTILDRIAVLNSAKVRIAAKKLGYDFEKTSERRIATEEVLAYMAQNTPELGWVQRAVAAVRTFLREHVPGFSKMQLSDSELIRNYIIPARNFVEKGSPNGGAKGGKAMDSMTGFSRGSEIKQDQTETPEFKKWFGDSKVVNAQGEPLVVYHGSPNKFSEFQVGRESKNFGSFGESTASRLGIFFATEKLFAKRFSPKGGVVMPTYLSLQNPVDLVDGFPDSVWRKLSDVLKENNLESIPPDGMWDLFDKGFPGAVEFVDALKAVGYDGAKIVERSADGNLSEVFVAFNPTQIKSATGNNGDFDAANPDIRMSRSGTTPDVSDTRTGISTALLELGKDDSLYQYPRSDARELKDIAADKSAHSSGKEAAPVKVMDVDKNTSDTDLWMLANTAPDDNPAENTKSWIVETSSGKYAAITRKGKEVYINVASVGEGNRGSQVYDLAANYALNNGLTFIGDPMGVSKSALRRRLENMLSSAIKYGTTDHLQPHEDQVAGAPDIGVPPLRWTKGDTLGNIRSMVDVSIKATDYANPIATRLVDFEPGTQSFRDDRGEPIEHEGLANYLSDMLGSEQRQRGVGAAGNTTLRRNALFKSLLQSVGNRTSLMESIHRERVGRGAGAGASLSKSFYSRGVSQAGIPTTQAQSIVDAIKARWANAPEIVVVSDMSDARIPKEVRAEDQKRRSNGATGEPEGFYHKGKVYLLASQLNSPTDVVRVLLHETVGHFGLRGVFGKTLGDVLDQLTLARRGEVIAKARGYGLVRSDANGNPAVDVETATDAQVWAAMDRPHKQVAAEEVLAVLAQTNPQLGFVRRAVSAIRAWLRTNIPGFGNMKMTDADIIANFIIPARNFVEKGSPNGGAKGGKAMDSMTGFSLGSEIKQDQTETPAFRKWYGDWKGVGNGRNSGNAERATRDERAAMDAGGGDAVVPVQRTGDVDADHRRPVQVGSVLFSGASGPVGEDSRPVRFYHGTRDDVDSFSTSHPNRLDKGWLGRGVYATDSSELADSHAEFVKRPGSAGPNTLPLFMAVKNPYVASIAVKQRLKNASQAEICQRRLNIEPPCRFNIEPGRVAEF